MPLQVQVAKQFPNFALDVSFTAGDAPLGILGPSGAGKTMLLRCIAGLEQPDRGRIDLNGRVLLDTAARIRVPARNRRVGLLFQHYALFPNRTVAENIAFGLRNLPAEEQSRRLTALIERTHARGLESRYPRELSGGEQQRVALARALSIEPEALLLDEPLSALDTHLRSQVETQLQETFAAYRRPALVVTHNIEEAYRLGEQLLVLARGRVAAFGDKEEIFRHPPSLEVAQLTGCKNFSRSRAVSDYTVEAIDWGCNLRVAHALARPAGTRRNSRTPHRLRGTFERSRAGSQRGQCLPLLAGPFLRDALPHHTLPALAPATHKIRRAPFASGGLQGKVGALPQSPAALACAAFPGFALLASGIISRGTT